MQDFKRSIIAINNNNSNNNNQCNNDDSNELVVQALAIFLTTIEKCVDIPLPCTLYKEKKIVLQCNDTFLPKNLSTKVFVEAKKTFSYVFRICMHFHGTCSKILKRNECRHSNTNTI